MRTQGFGPRIYTYSVKKLGSFRSWVILVSLGNFIRVKLKGRLRVGQGDAYRRKGEFVSLFGLHVAARCIFKVMTHQLTVHIQAI